MKPFICEIGMAGAPAKWFRVEAPDPVTAANTAVTLSGHQGALRVAVFKGHSIPWGDGDRPVLNRNYDISKKPDKESDLPQHPGMDAPQAITKRGNPEKKIQAWLKKRTPSADR